MHFGNNLNNPGNIRTSNVSYKGEITSSNPAFKQFSDMKYGFRAMASLLYHYINSNGLNTIRKIINTYAPSSDGNNPDSYAKYVADKSGVGIDDILSNVDFDGTMFFDANIQKIIHYMTEIEQGVGKTDTSSLKEGFQLFKTDQGLA